MKRALLTFVAGLALCAAAYSAFYFLGTSRVRAMAHEAEPELGWLKTEFHLSDAEFVRISELHAAYEPHCAEMCRRIAAKNAEIREALARTNAVTPEVEQKLREAQQLRAECHIAMLKHFIAVSQSMPPAEGRRYLAWVEEKTFLPRHGGGMEGMSGMDEHHQ